MSKTMTSERLAEIRGWVMYSVAERELLAALDESRAETEALRARVRRLREALEKCAFDDEGDFPEDVAKAALLQDDAVEAGK